MADIVRRTAARVPCDRPVEVYVGAASGRKLGDGRLKNVSLAGAYLAFPVELQRGTPYRLRVEDEEGALDLPCRVAREGPRADAKSGHRHYGLAFNLTAEPERRLRRLLDVLRRAGSPNETRIERSLRDYWSS